MLARSLNLCQTRLSFAAGAFSSTEDSGKLPAAAVDFLWNEQKRQYVYFPGPLRIKAFDVTHTVARSVPAYRMRFPKSDVDWEAIDAAME
jgi:hypothetical protein